MSTTKCTNGNYFVHFLNCCSRSRYPFSHLQFSPPDRLHAGTSFPSPNCNFYSFVHLSNAANERSYGADIIHPPYVRMREGGSARKGNVVVGGADDKWRCLFARNRGANGFDCGALARKRSRWRKHATPSPHPKNNEEIEDGDSSRTRYLIITLLLHSPDNGERACPHGWCAQSLLSFYSGLRLQ